MRKFFLLLIIFSVALGGCGDVDWFPEQGVASFSFSPDTVTDVAPGSTVTSNTITVNTRNASETITVTGGEYSINGAAPTAAAGTVKNGDQVTVQHQASSEAGGEVVTTLRIGDKSATFRSRTVVPLQFDPPIVLNATPARDIESSVETVSIATGSAPISITGGSYSLDGGAFVTDARTVNNGQTVRVRHTTAAAGTTGAAATKVTKLTIGETTSTFTTSVTGVATQVVSATGAAGALVEAQGMSLVSGSQTITVAEGFGLFSLDGEIFFDTPQTATLFPGQTIFLSDTQTASDSTIFNIGSSQVIILQVTRTTATTP